MVRDERERLPGGALLALTIGEEAVDAARVPLQTPRERTSRREPGAVPQAPGREADTGMPARRRVSGEARVVLVEGAQLLVAELPARPERDVERARRVALRKDEEIVGTEQVAMDEEHRVEGGEVAADVADARLEVHLQKT